MITKFDRNVCRILRERLDAALVGLGEELGVSIRAGHISFSPGNANVKLEVAVILPDGTVQTEEIEDFQALAELYGLKKGDLGRTFQKGSHAYTISGMKPKSRKYPILATRDDGRRFKFPVSTVKAALAS